MVVDYRLHFETGANLDAVTTTILTNSTQNGELNPGAWSLTGSVGTYCWIATAGQWTMPQPFTVRGVITNYTETGSTRGLALHQNTTSAYSAGQALATLLTNFCFGFYLENNYLTGYRTLDWIKFRDSTAGAEGKAGVIQFYSSTAKPEYRAHTSWGAGNSPIGSPIYVPSGHRKHWVSGKVDLGTFQMMTFGVYDAETHECFGLSSIGLATNWGVNEIWIGLDSHGAATDVTNYLDNFIISTNLNEYPLLPWDTLIPSSRTTDWTLSGISGGIPDTSGWTELDVTDYGAVGDGVTDDTTAILATITAAATSNRIYFPAGTYLVSDTIDIHDKSLELVGDGPTVSIIVNNETNFTPVIKFGESLSVTDYQLWLSAPKDAYQVTVTDATGLAVGDLVILDQTNDMEGRWTGYPVTHYGYGNPADPATWVSRDSGTRAEGMMALITNITYTNVSFTPPLATPLFTNLDAQLARQAPTYTLKWSGMRDLCIRNNGQNGTLTQRQVEFNYTAYFWVTNCELNRGLDAFLWINRCVFGEVCHNRIHGHLLNYASHGYGIEVLGQSASIRIEDNILGDDLHSPVHIENGSTRNVVGYNYASWFKTNETSVGVVDYTDDHHVFDFNGSHGAQPRLNLFEGNVGSGYRSDYTWGTACLNTVFRNYFRGGNFITNYTSHNVNCVEVSEGNWFINVVGNVLGSTNWTFTFSGTYSAATDYDTPYIRTVGWNSTEYLTGASNVAPTLLWHGNWDRVNEDTVWDVQNFNHTLPSSLYLAAKPAWWGSEAWPPIGPDISPTVNRIPAETRYLGAGSRMTAITVRAGTVRLR